jgi:hypothetical protein
MAGGRFTPAVASVALRDRRILAPFLVLIATLLGLGAGCLVLSLPAPHPMVPFLTRDQGRVSVGAVGLLVILADVGLVAFLVSRTASYINAPSLASLLVDRLDVHPLLRGSESELTIDEKTLAFLPLLELLNYAVRNGDRATVARMMAAITSKLLDWLHSASTPPAQRIFLDEFREGFLQDIPELIERHGVPSLHAVYLPALGQMARDAWDVDHTLLDRLLEHLCETTVTLMLSGEDRAAARGIRSIFNLEEHVATDPSSRDRVHQALGSIGRAVGHVLPATLGYRHDAPGFGYLDESRSEVMDELEEGYWRVCDARSEAADSNDACLWLEAIEVTAVALIERGMETSKFKAVKNHTISLMSDASRAVLKLAYSGCDRAPILWALALERLAHLHFPPDQNELWDSIAEDLVQIGSVAIDLNLTFFGGGPIADRCIEALSDVPPQCWAGAIQEVSFHGINDPPDHQARWQFTTRAGVFHHTNFGLMFDENTGELYPDDDPRRR